MTTIQYNGIIRKLTVAFGEIFNNITIARFNPDGSEQERFLIPIAYAGKEKYVARLQGDPVLDRLSQLGLPQLAFTLIDMHYDHERKLNSQQKIFGQTSTGLQSTPGPVPYDFNFEVYVYSRNIDDGNQIIERILPFFNPDYTLKLNLNPTLNIIKEIPIHLNSVSFENDYEGGHETSIRSIIWTLSFTVKGFLFGKTTQSSVILSANTNILSPITTTNGSVTFVMSNVLGRYKEGEWVYQGPTYDLSLCVGKVVTFSNIANTLLLTNTSGTFRLGAPIIGANSFASGIANTYWSSPVNDVTINIVPNPTNANVSNVISYTTTITETKA